MENRSRMTRNILFGALLSILLVVVIIAFLTYNNATTDGAWGFFVKHHMAIMGGLVLISIIFGFASAQVFYAELQQRQKDSRKILEVVLLFLSKEEREIVNYLVEQEGITTQAEVARLPSMNRVKAHRSLQKMQEKQLIDLTSHGKVRKVKLKENILQLLQEK
jgi:uncharacterized membrane protein